MERKTTKFKYLLLIPALFLGLSVIAQKAEPVKQASGQSAVNAVSNHRPANWQLEQELQGVLDGKGGTANSAKPKPIFKKDNPQQWQEYKAKKALLALEAQKNLNPELSGAVDGKMKQSQMAYRADALTPPAGYTPSSSAIPMSVTPGGKYPTDIAYAHNHWATGSIPNGPVSFALNAPGTLTSIADYGTPWIYGSSWANGEWYGTEGIGTGNPTDSKFFTVNTNTGARTYINNSQFGGSGNFIAELAYDWTSSTMYGYCYNFTTSEGSLYTIDLATGVPTLVGVTGAYACYYLGCNQEGNLYAADVVGNVLIQLNKSTGAATVIGPVGFDIAFVGGLEFDNSDNTMYATAFDYGPYYGLLYTVNLSTGVFTAVGPFPDTYMSGFAIQNQPFITYPDDIGVTAIVSPTTSPYLTNAEQIHVKIKNFGSAAQSSFLVQYTINGGTPVIEPCTTNVAAGSVIDFTFNTTADLSAYTTYTIVACTFLPPPSPGDQNTLNDCKTAVVTRLMPTWTDTIRPQNLPYWTGTTNGTSFTENSKIKLVAGNVNDGWAKFDITSIPDVTQISSLKLGYYAYEQNLGYFRLKQMVSDPMAGTPGSVMSELQNGITYIDNISNGYSVGWHTYDLPAQARTDFANSTLQNWFAVGFYEYESSGWSVSIEGWAEQHKPYLAVTFGYIPGPDDVGITAITSPITGAGYGTAEPVVVQLRNYGTNTQTSVPVTVTITGPSGPVTLSNTYTGSLAGNSFVNFTVGNADLHMFGNYTVHACTQLPGDNFGNNDCFSSAFVNKCPVKVITATSPVSGSNLTATEPLSVTLLNIGTTPIVNPTIQYSINGGVPVQAIYNGTLAVGVNTVFDIGTLDMHWYGTYNIQVCPFYAGNTYPNDGCFSWNVINSIPTVTDTFWPQNLAFWTGNTNGTVKENNPIKFSSAGVQEGWAKFDITAMPAGATVNNINLNMLLMQASGGPGMYVRRLVLDPVSPANTAQTLLSAITSGQNYSASSGYMYTLGWQAYDLNDAAKADLSLQSAMTTTPKWFAVSIFEYETYAGYYGTYAGWQNVDSVPYLVVNYNVAIPHDVGIVSIDTDPFIAAGPYIPKATVKNFGTNTETFTITMDGPNGYSSIRTITNLAPNATQVVIFDSWNATIGQATLHACISLTSDLVLDNNCKSKSFTVDAKLTKVYAYSAGDPSGVLPDGPVTFFLEHPEVITSLAPTVSADFISAGCWANGVWYGAEFSDPANNSNLWTINPNTGAMTLVGPMGFNVSGLTFDHTTGIMWAVAAFQDALGAWRTNIYTVNMATGAMTLVRECGPIGLAINLACSQQGMLLFAEITNDRLWAYDPLIDELELMGLMGIDLNYAQDAEFDKATNVLYFAGYASTGTLYTVNLATGAITPVGNFQGGAEITGFAIPYTWTPAEIDMGAMWITHPTIGNLTDGEPVMVRVRNYGLTTCTDMNLTFQYGTYSYTDNWAVWGYPPIAPDVYFDYAFIPVLDLSAPGSHCIKAWISDVLPVGDVNQVNDTVAKCVNNISCGLITCFDNAIPEGEPCGNDENGGCYSTPNAFVDIAVNQAYCGTMWKIDTLRDTDWYKFTIGSPKGITIRAKAEFGLDIILVKLPCSNMEVIATKTITKCATDSLVISALQAGQYAIVFAPDWIDFNTACNNNTKYTFDWRLYPAKYCPANATVCDEYVANVQVNTTPAFSNPSGCTAGGYKDYTNLTINVDAGGTYQVTISNGPYTYTSDQCGIWIDWNVDFDFYDPQEKLEVTGTPGEGPYYSTFTVPDFAVPGPTRFRTRILFTGVVEPCGNTYYGEVEDYTIYVHAQIPAIVATVGSLNDACPGLKTVPITVDEFNGVYGFNLLLNLYPGLTYVGYQNVNPQLSSASGLNVIPSGNSVQLNWTSEIPVSIGSGTLVELLLQTTSGSYNLVWDTLESQFQSYITGVFDDVYVNGTLQFGNCSDLTGIVKYKNAINSILIDSVNVQLFKPGNVLQAQMNVDPTGHFAFLNLPNNTYTLKANSIAPQQKAWVGGNATDALLILKHYVGMPPPLAGLNLIVADVNQSGPPPNAVDALAVSRRYVQAITTFAPAPDWYFQTFTVTIDGTANQVREIRGLCAGDVNGSGHPFSSVPSKLTPSVIINTEGTMYVDNQIVEVPVMVQNGMNVGAVSLVLNYPANLDILGVKVANSTENLTYTANNGVLRLAWFTLEPLELNAGEVLVTLQVKANSIADKDMNFFATVESAIANDAAQNYENASLMMPKLVSLNGTDNYSLSNYPNPFNATTEISYSIAKSGFVSIKVYNVLGEEVATVISADQKAGNYTVSFDGTKLPKGVYVYKLQVNDITKANSMVITQ